MSLIVLRCENCDGSIVFSEGKSAPECPFCGSTKQVQKPMDQRILPPEFVIPFSISDEEADAAFRVFAKSSFFRFFRIINGT